MPRILGITGNIACGKTVVGQMLLEMGAERYIDADAIVHRLYQPGQPIAVRVAEAFGPATMAPDGSVNRAALGEIVFHDAMVMHRLESIVHPAVSVAIAQELAAVSSTGIAIIDAVKLLEGGSGAFCQSKWLVICSQEQELARLMTRNHLSLAEAEARLLTQPSVEARIKLVDEVIDNNGPLEETYRQVAGAFERFRLKFQTE